MTVIITDAKRTPVGSFQGQLKHLSATQLGAEVVKNLSHEKVRPYIHSVYMGCVLTGAQAPARQAVRYAGLDDCVGAVTINKVCGSGLQSAIELCKDIMLGHYNCGIAGGMESMTNAPYFVPRARAGLRMGHAQILDHMLFDGLEDAYHQKAMGVFADETAQEVDITRDQQDQFAIASLQKALDAQSKGYFNNEIIPVVGGDKEKTLLTFDEPPSKGNPDKVPKLKPAFSEKGTVTAANASSIADGAAGVALMSQEKASLIGVPGLAKIVGFSSHAREPQRFTLAPIKAIEKLLNHVGWAAKDVDLFEINEAFAVVTLAAMKALNLPYEKVNVHGGACALGHPIGASGARLLVTLVHALHQHQLKKGIVCLCIGGGEAVAMAVERL